LLAGVVKSLPFRPKDRLEVPTNELAESSKNHLPTRPPEPGRFAESNDGTPTRRIQKPVNDCL
jgi:hypothetical protein